MFRFPLPLTGSLCGSLWLSPFLSLVLSLSLSGSLWLSVNPTLAPSGSLWLLLTLSGFHWLSLALTGSLPVSLWLSLALCDSHSGSHWLSLPLSGILWPSLAHYCSLISRIQPLIGSQGPCLALIADATMTHFIPLWCEPIVFQRNHFVQGKRNIGKYINHHVFVQF